MERLLALVEQAPLECVERAVSALFRRVLANLLLDFDNEKYRRVRRGSNALTNATPGLSDELVDALFAELGFAKTSDAYVFDGTKDSLRHADEVLSAIEQVIAAKKNVHIAPIRSTHSRTPQVAEEKHEVKVQSAITSDKEVETDDDFVAAAPLVETARHTLYMSGRVRNSFFDAKHFTLRVMRHGRAYLCSEKCSVDCLEAHWHHFTGRNMMYAFVAHLSADGTTLLHTGYEHGYQYNSIPGTPNFRHTIHFNEKLVDRDGRLVHNANMSKPVTQCIYCGMPFTSLFF